MKSTIWKSIGVFFVVFFTLAVIVTSTVNASEEVATITVGQFPAALAYDSGKGEIFVANLVAYGVNGTVSVIADNNNTVVATIPVGIAPQGLAYDAAKGEIFVANSGNIGTADNGTVSVISDSNNTVVATIPVGNQPQGIAYDPAKDEIFVANSYYNNAIASTICTVSVINDSTNTVVATINVGAEPLGVVYDSVQHEIFVSNEVSGTISVITDKDNKVFTTISKGAVCAEGMIYDSSKNEIFVANYCAAAVSIISDQNNSLVKTISPGGSKYLAYNPTKGEIYSPTGRLNVISDKSNTVVAEDNHSIGALVYDPGQNEIFGANMYGNTVSVLTASFNYTTPPSNPSAPSNPSTPYTPGNKSTPGFELLIVIGALAVVLFLMRKR